MTLHPGCTNVAITVPLADLMQMAVEDHAEIAPWLAAGWQRCGPDTIHDGRHTVSVGLVWPHASEPVGPKKATPTPVTLAAPPRGEQQHIIASFRYDPENERILHNYFADLADVPDRLLPVLIGSLETMKLDVYREYAARCEA